MRWHTHSGLGCEWGADCTTKDSARQVSVVRSIADAIVVKASVDPFALVRVGEIMDTGQFTIPAAMTIAELSTRIARGDAAVTRHQAIPIVDAEKHLVGIITRGDLFRALSQDPSGSVTVLEAGSARLLIAYPDELVDEALRTMLRNNVGRLLVVSRQDLSQLVGYLGARYDSRGPVAPTRRAAAPRARLAAGRPQARSGGAARQTGITCRDG
jgi:CBS domain-containing protein